MAVSFRRGSSMHQYKPAWHEEIGAFALLSRTDCNTDPVSVAILPCFVVRLESQRPVIPCFKNLLCFAGLRGGSIEYN